MNVWKPIALVAVAGFVGAIGIQAASADDGWKCPGHDNLTKAYSALAGPTGHMGNAQKFNDFDMKGHANNAKNFITQAMGEIQAACAALPPPSGK